MTFASASTCINHPERAAVEQCEVCGNPLCAYCLYYTSDGQRLCQQHAEKAAASGAFIRAPGVYAEGLIPAQLAAGDQIEAPPLYAANHTDLLALVGLLLVAFNLAICFPGAICLLGPIGMILSVVALLNARSAHNPSRTRRMAGIGLGLFGLWLVVAYACASLVFNSARSSITTISTTLNVPIMVITAPPLSAATQPPPTQAPTETSTPSSGR
jgi:hypothetical protein